MRRMALPVFLCLMVLISNPSYAFLNGNSLDSTISKMSQDLVKQGNLKNIFVMISPHDLYDANTRLSLPFAKLLREKLITGMKNAGARVLVDGADDEKFMILQGSWMDQGKDLALNLKIMRLTEDGPEVIASASGKLKKNKINPKLLTPDRDSWARYLVRSLEQKTNNWLYLRYYNVQTSTTHIKV